MLGFDGNELVGQPMHTVLHHSHPDGSHYPREECPIYAAFRDGQVHTVTNEVFWRRDGSSFPVEYTSTPIHRDVAAENEYLQEEISTEHGFHQIVGDSAPILRALQAVEVVAPTDASALITGETGTGKELIARAVHDRSERRDKPLIKVNCASIPRELFESEFFGHVRGAFTGAIRDRIGRFELADRGSIFLDEVGEIPLEMQSKLLRVLQDGNFERLGDPRTRAVDVRVIAATNRDLEAAVAAGRFREDLYYRLNVFPIPVAPLRNRLGDIPALANHFMEQARVRLNRPDVRLTNANVAALQAYDWPGNVRELQNCIERAAIRADPSGAMQMDLPDAADAGTTGSESVGSESGILSEAGMRGLERANTLAALEAADWKVSGAGGAAELLGMRPTTLASRIKKLGLSRTA